ncbi:hypothetical protein RJ639_028633 [Escallonia herrerae]|uniref:Uncharacterized protein n=1 Tax=Escallonia herrerae TaxID=1293975 RepID=A0AA88X7T8_9ASTE|nr:hypothetical protein RJ639_028633 [Escallonia herrerae]
MAKGVSYMHDWFEVAPAPLVSPQKPSNAPKLETIVEEGCERLDVLLKRLLCLLPVVISLLLIYTSMDMPLLDIHKNPNPQSSTPNGHRSHTQIPKPDLIPVPHSPDFHADIDASPAHFRPPLPASTSGLHFWQFMIAGLIAGMVEHMAMFPVDLIKTRMQALGSCPMKTAGIRQAVGSSLRSEGPAGLYHGIGAMGLSAGPAHAVYFSIYEVCNKAFFGGKPNNAVAHAGAGVCATVASDAVFTRDGRGEAATAAEQQSVQGGGGLFEDGVEGGRD